MNTIIIYTLLSITVVSLISFIGALTLSFSIKKLKSITIFLISLSAGTLLGGSILHLMPEVIEQYGSSLTIWIWLLTGIITFFILEKLICWRHCHIPTSSEHKHPLGAMNLIGDCLHNFIDGVIIAGSFLVSIPLGLATTIAVIAHEVPQEIGDFGILIHAGYSRGKALLLNFMTALTAFAGALLVLFIGLQLENLAVFIIPFTAGGFIYIATSDLLPEIKKEPHLIKSLFQLLSVLFGIGIMLLLKLYF